VANDPIQTPPLVNVASQEAIIKPVAPKPRSEGFISMDLYNRLSACGVIKRSFHLKKLPSMNLVDLDPDHTNKLKSGSLLAGYLLVFKSLLKS